ncbi:hypothetical protein [Prosthecobacter vanneervenii]|uniref:Uncharacterized protein n=1 Tax=Prosthecobacter vanneervenii TaxID=48466 RepID=A0A7W7Y8K9_9BACT|nr:hypothetical protein [Prosthecobacter vanneervenii]MBB5031407.1 hypothetical protein [Prosthecobacter vanneervenii]
MIFENELLKGDFSSGILFLWGGKRCCLCSVEMGTVNKEHEPSTVVSKASSSSLGDAAAFIRGSLCSNGYPHGEVDDFDRFEKEWEALIQWAKESGSILAASSADDARPGGREHDVRFDDGTGLWWKYTKINSSGYTVSWKEDATPYMHNASPLEYFSRMQRQNEHFGDDVILAGLCNAAAHDWRIVTTQPGVSGKKATLLELKEAFELAEFELLPWTGIGYENSLSFRKEGIDVWDIHPANVLISPIDGLPVPFDVMITNTP